MTSQKLVAMLIKSELTTLQKLVAMLIKSELTKKKFDHHKVRFLFNYPVSIYMLHWRRSGVFIVNFEHISYLVLVFLLITLNM